VAEVLFYVLALAAIAFGAGVVVARVPLFSVLSLLGAFFALAGIYLLMGFPFLAATQLLVYAGAIMVLFLFVVMLLNVPKEDGADWDQSHPLRLPAVTRLGSMLAVLLVVQLAWALIEAGGIGGPVDGDRDGSAVSSVRELGRTLFTDYVFAFEATSILILVAMVGAVMLARREGERS
jgi:NADH-quinone oxidoreductase subunit J